MYKIKRFLYFFIIISLICILGGCSSKNKQVNKDKKIVVGSKSFTENNLLAELYALALEANGYTIERKLNIAGAVVHQAITNNDIDLYPEYTGTALISILKKPAMTDSEEIYQIVSDEYKKQFQLIWLNYAPMNDGQGLVIRTEAAQKYGIKTISDLQKNADKLRFASQGDFDEREDGLPALEEVYGSFAFLSDVVYEDNLKYDVLSNNEADIAVAYTTEGALVNKEFTLLEDDKKAWPPYNAAPVVRADILERNPEIEQILNVVSQELTTEEITKLNAKVDIEKQEMEEVAAEYFENIKEKVIFTKVSRKAPSFSYGDIRLKVLYYIFK